MKSLKLNELSTKQLTHEQMSSVTGGAQVCGCGCCYAGNGGSSTNDNGHANLDNGWYSTACDNTMFVAPDK
jgi:natural product precursor